jgi:uncharacterized protein (DUF1330 family)
MSIVNPTLAQIEAFEREAPDGKPIVMVNLLRFRALADYASSGQRDEGGTGKQAYGRYSKAVMPLLWEVGGQPLWMGKGRASVIAPDGEAWDEVLLVYYPSRAAFMRMVRSPAYQATMHHRTAALSDARLFETRAVRLPRWVLAAARGAFRLKAVVAPKIR